MDPLHISSIETYISIFAAPGLGWDEADMLSAPPCLALLAARCGAEAGWRDSRRQSIAGHAWSLWGIAQHFMMIVSHHLNC